MGIQSFAAARNNSNKGHHQVGPVNHQCGPKTWPKPHASFLDLWTHRSEAPALQKITSLVTRGFRFVTMVWLVVYFVVATYEASTFLIWKRLDSSRASYTCTVTKLRANTW